MLKEWIHNLPLERLLAIINDQRARNGMIWRLAVAEVANRQASERVAAS